MSVISAQIIAKIAAAAATEGLDRDALLKSCGVDPENRVNPAQMVPADRHYAVWETIMRQLQSPGFPLRYAATIRPEDYGALGLAGKTAPNLRAAWDRAVRYLIVLTNSSWLECREGTTASQLIFRREGRRSLGLRCATEAALAELVHFAREITGVNLMPVRMCFQHRAPGDTAEHERFFGGELSFGDELDCIEFMPSHLDLPVLRADDGMARFFIDQLDQTKQGLTIERSLAQSLKRLICDALPSGPPAMDDVAQRLGMSPRTLQRRLAEVDTTFQKFLENTRRDLSKHLLQRTGHPLAEIAFLLGFSEQSAFQRAFKRWNGLTPAEFRAGKPA